MSGRALILTGPTGSGKSALAVRLAAELPFEIVSVDSAMVFRGLDVGTAKPDRATRQRHPHHLIDLIEPTDSYSAGRFVRDASEAMDQIRSRGRVPLLVGGTMLYFRALAAGLADLPRDPALRRFIDARAAAQGWPALHTELAQQDPIAASRIDPHDAQRIQRALEVIALTGRPLSHAHRPGWRDDPGPSALRLVLAPTDRGWLHRRLSERLKDMMERGFVEEVRGLYARGDLRAESPAMRAVGYRQLWAHASGACSLAMATERALSATRQLAKRQLTWLRREPGAAWYDPADPGHEDRLLAAARAWLRAGPEP